MFASSLPGHWLHSPSQWRVGLSNALFEASSAFTPAEACLLAEPLMRGAHMSKCFNPFRRPDGPLRRLLAGLTVTRAGFAPSGNECLSTADAVIWR